MLHKSSHGKYGALGAETHKMVLTIKVGQNIYYFAGLKEPELSTISYVQKVHAQFCTKVSLQLKLLATGL